MLPQHSWLCGSQGTALPLDLFFPPAELLSTEMWSWVFLSVGEVTPANSVFPAGAFRISVFPVIQAAEGWVLGAACPDALLNVLAHTMLTTATLCRLSLRFHVLAHMKSLVYKPVSRHFN